MERGNVRTVFEPPHVLLPNGKERQKDMKRKSAYQKPAMTVQHLVSREDISAQTLDAWLAAQADFGSDSGLENAIDAYSVSSLLQ